MKLTALNVLKTLHPHLFRHALAQGVLEATGNI
jgi:site-specific recombinase XerC